MMFLLFQFAHLHIYSSAHYISITLFTIRTATASYIVRYLWLDDAPYQISRNHLYFADYHSGKGSFDIDPDG